MAQTTRLTEQNYLTADLTTCEPRFETKLPTRPATGPPIGMTLSGGGFRATFPALGVARYLADAGLLGNLWISSSVSGGSVANSIIATRWPKLREQGFSAQAVDELLIDPTVKRIADKSLKWYLAKNVWRTVGSKNRTDLLAWAFSKWFLGDDTLDKLDPGVRWVMNAANMATGTRFTFERTHVGDYVNGHLSTEDAKVKIALAAATSCAVPGAFSPIELKGMDFPCRGVDTVSLLDGGAYDNTGIEVLNGKKYDDVFTICLAAGGLFKVGGYGKMPVVRHLKQANNLLYRQSRALRTRDMVGRFGDPKTKRQGVLFKLNTSQEAVEAGCPDENIAAVHDFVARYPPVDFHNDVRLAEVGTSFDKFDEELSRKLVRKGWWTTGLTMAGFHPQMSPLATNIEPPPI